MGVGGMEREISGSVEIFLQAFEALARSGEEIEVPS